MLSGTQSPLSTLSPLSVTSTESIVRQVVDAVLKLCEDYCSNGRAKTVIVKARHANHLVNTSIRALGEVLEALYVIECRDLPKVRQKLLQLLT